MGDAGRPRRPLVRRSRRSTPASHASPGPRRWIPGPPLALLCVGLLGALASLLVQARHLWFFGDEWVFLLDRRFSGTSVLEPHNEHWSTLPLLVYRIGFHVLGLDHYLIWALLPAALHLTICLLLHALLRRHGFGRWTSVLTALVLAFLCGAIAENPLWVFQIGFLGSAALGTAAVLVLDRWGGTRAGMAATWGVSVLSLMCSGMALPLLLWLGTYTVLRRGLLTALAATVPPAVVYLLWYATYGNDADPSAPSTSVDLVLEFSAAGLASLWQLVLRVPETGGIAFLLLLGFSLLAPLPPRTRALALSGMLAAVGTFMLLGVSRSGLGVAAASASRYAYFGVLMTLPAAAVLLDAASRALQHREATRRTAYAILTAVLVISGIAQTDNFSRARQQMEPALEQRTLGALALARSGEVLLVDQVEPTYSPDLTTTQLRRPEVAAALDAAGVTPQGRLDASVALQVAVASSSFEGLARVVGLRGRDVSRTTVPLTGCRKATSVAGAYVDIPPSPGSQLVLVPRSATVPVQMIGSRGQSAIRTLTVTPGAPTWLASTAAEATLRVYVDAPTFELCAP